jgi:hypothetical protein
MDVVEFRRLMDRVVATRNAESRAFLLAFDLAPAVMRGSAAQTSAKWDTWGRTGEALLTAVANLQQFLAANVARDLSGPAGGGGNGSAGGSIRVPVTPRTAAR